MKKVSLNSVKSFLSREEMQVINGGKTMAAGTCSCKNGKVFSVTSCESCGDYCPGQTWICSGA